MESGLEINKNMVMSTHKRAVMISFMCKILKYEICKRQGVKGWLPGDGGVEGIRVIIFKSTILYQVVNK